MLSQFFVHLLYRVDNVDGVRWRSALLALVSRYLVASAGRAHSKTYFVHSAQSERTFLCRACLVFPLRFRSCLLATYVVSSLSLSEK